MKDADQEYVVLAGHIDQIYTNLNEHYQHYPPAELQSLVCVLQAAANEIPGDINQGRSNNRFALLQSHPMWSGWKTKFSKFFHAGSRKANAIDWSKEIVFQQIQSGLGIDANILSAVKETQKTAQATKADVGKANAALAELNAKMDQLNNKSNDQQDHEDCEKLRKLEVFLQGTGYSPATLVDRTCVLYKDAYNADAVEVPLKDHTTWFENKLWYVFKNYNIRLFKGDQSKPGLCGILCVQDRTDFVHMPLCMADMDNLTMDKDGFIDFVTRELQQYDKPVVCYVRKRTKTLCRFFEKFCTTDGKTCEKFVDNVCFVDQEHPEYYLKFVYQKEAAPPAI